MVLETDGLSNIPTLFIGCEDFEPPSN